MRFILILFLLLGSLGMPYTLDASDEHPSHTPRYFTPPLTVSAKDLRCLTAAIYYESGNQSMSGQEAVGIVVINRVYHPRYPKNICGVVYQSTTVHGKRICQFSFACQPRSSRNPQRWNQSKIIATNLLHNRYHFAILSSLNRSLWFHATYVHPAWAHHTQRTLKIGDHIFYQEKRS